MIVVVIMPVAVRVRVQVRCGDVLGIRRERAHIGLRWRMIRCWDWGWRGARGTWRRWRGRPRRGRWWMIANDRGNADDLFVLERRRVDDVQ